MSKVTSKHAKKALAAAKKERVPRWSLVSYSIDKDVLARFKRACKRQGVTGSALIQEFMKVFIENKD